MKPKPPPKKKTGIPIQRPPEDAEDLSKRTTAYYDDSSKDYWIENERGMYMRLSETALKRYFKSVGLNDRIEKGSLELISQVDARVQETQFKNHVVFAGSLAGMSKGAHEIEGRLVLVKDSPKLIEPVGGDFPLIRQLVSGLLDSEGVEQSGYLYGWLKFALECLRCGKNSPGQALVLAGEPQSGKSLLQLIITELLGGRSAKPYQFMMDGTKFNADLFGAEHLMVEDESASTDIRARRHFGAMIKQVTANSRQRMHGKNRDGITLTPFWRISISLNNEPENLQVLPPLDDSLKDKMILLKARKHPMPMPVSTGAEQEIFWNALKAELPAFVDYLLKMEIPSANKSDRYGITHFHHPQLLEGLNELSPEHRLLEYIETFMASHVGLVWIGSATDLENELKGIFDWHELNRLLAGATSLGRYLGRLADRYPERFQQKKSMGHKQWHIRRGGEGPMLEAA